MAKICPITKHPVLYLTCLECDSKDDCEDLRRKAYDSSDTSSTGDQNVEDSFL